MPGNMSQCLNLVIEASGVENEGMEFDGQGKVAEAIAAYKKAAEGLQRAVDVCPAGHPDGPVLAQHRKEVLERVTYLEGLNPNETPSIPLDAHIKGVQLTMSTEEAEDAPPAAAGGPPAAVPPSQAKTTGATAAMAGAAGLIMIGPIAGLLAAGGAAYATTRTDKVGDIARGVGQTGVSAADKVKALNEQHGITDKAKAAGSAAASKAKEVDDKYSVTEKTKQAASTAAQKAQEFNEKHQVTDKAKEAGTVAAQKAAEFNDKHKVTEKIGKGLQFGIGKVAGLMSKDSKPSSGSSGAQ